MKTILLFFLQLIIADLAKADDFYYYKNEKLKLELNTQYLYVLCNLNSKEKLNEHLKAIGEVTIFNADIYHKRLIKTFATAPEYLLNEQNHYAEIKLNNDHLSKDEFRRIVSTLKNDTSILNVSFHYTYNGGDHFAVTNYVWVQVKDSAQIPLLVKEANKINYSVLGQNPFMKNWVMVGANKDATVYPLQASRFFVEQKLFEFAEPDMLTTLHLAVDNCVNDSLFISQQNELSNGGTFGPNKIPMDIQACGAWRYSTGVGVDIAVVDEGFENDHPDLVSNVVNTGYDAILGSSPTHVYGPHGTSCAGIAAAKGNNSIGVAGVAYNSGLMSVAINRFDPPSWAQRADAINWAWANGAEVISNSWNTSVGVPSSFFDAAVIYTQTFGRGGLGSVVVFSTNNWGWSYIEYPANSNADVIAVGASQDSTRATFTVAPAVASNYGPGLDIVAPGVGLASTDLQVGGYNTTSGSAGYYVSGFQGTSGACPIIAGVAALILSVNPCLNQHDVGTIINRTASKMGNYSYTTTVANPDGTWNNEMGYGFVDADAAVIMAQSRYLQNLTNTGSITYHTPIIQAGYNVNPFLTNGNYTTTSTANVTIQASQFIDFETGCDLQGTVNAQITSVGSCSTW